MDVQNISNLESPLYNTLVSKAQRDPWTYSLLANVPSFSKSRVVVNAASTPPEANVAGGSHLFKIPRYGLLTKCVLRFKLKSGHSEDLTTAAAQNWNAKLGIYNWDDIALQTHNKRIQVLYPEYIHMRSTEKGVEKRQSSANLSGRAFYTTASQSAWKSGEYFYTELPFAFSERPQNFLDTRFVENLEIVATQHGYTGNDKNFAALAAHVVNLSSPYVRYESAPQLLCYYMNPTEELYRAYQERNFTLERPLTMLQYDVYRESKSFSNMDLTSGDVDKRTFLLPLACNNLIFKTHIMIRQKRSKSCYNVAGDAIPTGLQRNDKFASIDTIIIRGTSRELVNTTGFELLNIDSQEYGRFVAAADHASIAGGDTGATTNGAEAMYTINWGLDASRASCSGAISLKNVASPEIEVVCQQDTNATQANVALTEFDFVVLHEYFQLVTIQGSDGRVSVGVAV